MMKNIGLVIAVASILAACGGGGDNKNSDSALNTSAVDQVGKSSSVGLTVDQLVGTWVSKCEVFSNSPSEPMSGRSKFVIVKKSSNSFQVDLVQSKWETFKSTNCTGTVANSGAIDEASNEITITGQKSIEGKTVTKINGTDVDGTWKDVLYLDANKLYFGATDSTDPLDSEGYPARLDVDWSLTKV